MQVISSACPEWVFPFTGLQPAQFRRLVRLVPSVAGAPSLTVDPAGSRPSTCPAES